jgi:hypothetical protein
MFEKDIELAPPGSDRKTSFIIAQGFAELLGGIESALDELVTILHNDTFEDAPDEVDEEPFPHFDTATHEGPVANSTDLTAAVDATVKMGHGPMHEVDPNVVFDNHTKNLRQEERELDPIAQSFTRNTADES